MSNSHLLRTPSKFTQTWTGAHTPSPFHSKLILLSKQAASSRQRQWVPFSFSSEKRETLLFTDEWSLLMKRRALFTATPFIYRPVFQVVIEGHSTKHPPTVLTLSASPTNPFYLILYLTAPPHRLNAHTHINTIPPLNPMLFPIPFHPAFFSPSSVLDLCPNWFEAYSLTQTHAKFDSLHSVVLLGELAHSPPHPTPLSVFSKLLSFSRCNKKQPMPVRRLFPKWSALVETKYKRGRYGVNLLIMM